MVDGACHTYDEILSYYTIGVMCNKMSVIGSPGVSNFADLTIFSDCFKLHL